MLRRTMNALTPKLKLGLEDLLADLWQARRNGDLGRLAYRLRAMCRIGNGLPPPSRRERSVTTNPRC